MTRINREELLKQLDAVGPGLSPKELIEQSNCFVFHDGGVHTFNDEIACTIKSPLDIEGAVIAGPMMELLRKLPDEELDVGVTDKGLIVKGQRRRATLRMEREILLPVEAVEDPKDWTELPEHFLEGIDISLQCISSDQSQFVLTCVHIGPKWLESCDNFQLTRYSIKTGFQESALVRGASLKHLPGLGVTECCRTPNWLHFRNPSGLVLSCRRYLEDYPPLEALLDMDGERVTLPKDIDDAVSRAEIFSGESQEQDNKVLVQLKGGRLRLTGRGPSGEYEEMKKVDYDGDPIGFMITPKLLLELTKRSSNCLMGDGRLKVEGEKFVYVTCTTKMEN